MNSSPPLSYLLVTFILALTFIASPSVSSAAEKNKKLPPKIDPKSTTFVCQMVDDVHSTVAQTIKEDIPVIKWVQEFYEDSNETPLERCSRVSSLIQGYIQQGTLKYIKIGKIDGRKAVCSAENEQSPCRFLLFKLEEDENPRETLEIFIYLLNNPLYLGQSSEKRVNLSTPSPGRLYEKLPSKRYRKGVARWLESLQKMTSSSVPQRSLGTR